MISAVESTANKQKEDLKAFIILMKNRASQHLKPFCINGDEFFWITSEDRGLFL